MNDSSTMTSSPSDIAVIGMACRFPGDGDSVDRFWNLICEGRSAYSENPERWNPDAFHFPQKKLNASLPRGAHFLQQDIATFDANFFNISKAEAEAMDPQQRMVMETTVEAMDQGGLPAGKLAGTQTGVWMANFTSDYREMLYRDPESAPMYTLAGASNTSTSNRISYFFNFKGPSFTLNTACSSSLVATHLACQSLALGESSTAIVGGTSLLLNPDLFMFLSNQNFLAADGRCKAFDESGDGYGRGEGAAVLILKRVEDAIADGDPIRAVIRGSAVNQDGRTKGMTLPSADAQVQLIQTAYKNAGVSMDETRYVEAHGTGTRAGDTTETEALSRTLSQVRSSSDRLLLGSVKANIGHLEACAGLASIIKCVCILETGYIPPTPSYKKGNPGVKWDEWNLKVPTSMTRWPTDGLRRLSTQGFGYGGTNAHLVIDDAFHYLQSRSLPGNHYSVDLAAKQINGLTSNTISHRPRVFCLSAQDRDGLKRMRASLSQHLADKGGKLTLIEDDKYLSDLSYTLSQRRSRLQWRTFFIASSLAQLQESLLEEPWPNPETRSPPHNPRIGFIFTGQGAQWAGMGMHLMKYDVFRDSVERSSRFIKHTLCCKWDVVEELSKPDTSSRLGLATFSQTLCTVLQVALVDLLASWNVTPSSVAGHSSGEIGAAYCLGALSHEDAVKIAYYRGILSSEMKEIDPSLKGAMMAVGASAADVQRHIDSLTQGTVVVACVNSPSSVTASGDVLAIEELEGKLKEQGIFARKLKVDTAYHSPHMQTIAGDYFDAISDISVTAALPGRRMHSSVVGRTINSHELGAGNWVRNLVSPVQFADAVHDLVRPMGENGERATENAVDLLIEVGPHPALQGPVNQTLKHYGISGVDYLGVLRRGQDDEQMALTCVGNLIASDVLVDLSAVHGDECPKPLVDLPDYPWNHSARFWSESRVSKEYRLRKHPRMPLLGAPCPVMDATERQWRGFIRLSEEPWVREHVIQDAILYPAAGFLAMAIEGAIQKTTDEDQTLESIAGVRLRDVQIHTALVLEDDIVQETILTFRPHQMGTLDSSSSWTEFTITSARDGQPPVQNCSGLLIVEKEAAEGSPMQLERNEEASHANERYNELSLNCATVVDAQEFYSRLDKLGLQYGPSFARLTHINHATDAGLCVGKLEIPQFETMNPPWRQRDHIVHPTVLDAIFHLTFAAMLGQPNGLKGALVPTSINELFVSTKIPFQPATQLEGFASASQFGFREWVSDINVLEPATATSHISIKGFRCADVSGGGNLAEGASIKPITFTDSWMPALDLLSPENLQKRLQSASSTSSIDQEAELSSRALQLDQYALACIQETVSKVSRNDVHADFAKFYEWMESELLPGQTISSSCHSDFPVIGDALPDIIRGKVDTHNVAEEKGVEFDKLMLDVAGWDSIESQLNEYMRLVHHQNPGCSILEIGSSVGSSSALSLMAHVPSVNQILDTAEFTFVQPGGAPGDAASKQFGDLKSRIKIEDHIPQPEDRKFDLVLVFSLGDRPTIAPEQVKNLLNPNGRVCVLEIVQPRRALKTLLGITMGCDRLSGSVSLSRSLGDAGFSYQAQVEGLSVPPQLRLTAAIVKAKKETPTSASELILVLPSTISEECGEIISCLEQVLVPRNIPTSRVQWTGNPTLLLGKSCIILTDLQKAILGDVSKADFDALQQVILHAESLLWVSGDVGPEASLVTGLARSIRNEIPGMQFKTLQITKTSLDLFPEMIDRVFGYTGSDTEFLAIDGQIGVSRLLEDQLRNESLATILGTMEPQVKQIPLKDTAGPVKLCIKNPGMLDSLCFESDSIPDTPLKDGTVEVDVKATGINFRDIMVAMGQIPDSLLGFEGAGIVRRVAGDVTAVKPGDRVCFLAHGAHRTVHRIRAEYAVPVPPEMPFHEAAGLLLAHSTAWYGLKKMANIEKGQTILIHAAAGGVGQAAIMLAQHVGLEIFATVGSDDKRELIRTRYGIHEDHIFNSRDLSFVQGVMRMTNGVGVDVILNSLSGEALRQTWTCIAPFGTFIEIGMKDILGNTRLDMRPFIRDATFTFINLNHLERDRPKLMSEILHSSMDLIKAGVLKSIYPVTDYPISKVEQSFRVMQAGKHRGKLTLTYDDDDVVPVIGSSFSSAQMSSGGCYMLVGGLGGLGRSLAQLFVRLGAKKLCFLSRSGATDPSAQKLVDDLTEQGADVLVCKSNVADAASLATAIETCTATLGPVKGVVQCAMVLRDSVFENMTYRQWIESTQPKVQGSWNLHTCLPDVDFFLILSSFAGVFGSRGQSNYAAAGAYEDALSAYRRSLGMKGITLDLGIMQDVGVLAEKGITDYLREWEGPCGIREPEFHALINHTLASELAGGSTAQIATGFATARTVQQSRISTPFYFSDPRFSILAQTGATGPDGSAAGDSASVQTQLTQSQSLAEAAGAISGALARRLADSLQSPISEIDTARPLHAFGIDSLVAVEYANWVFKEIKAKVTVFDLLANVPITSLAEKLVSKSALLSHLPV